MAELWVAKTPAADSPVGYKVRLNYGPAASNLIACAEPGGPLSERRGSVRQLSDAARRRSTSASSSPTPARGGHSRRRTTGTTSRSLLFALAIPYYHAGRAHDATGQRQGARSWPASSNGWNNVAGKQLRQDVHGVRHAQPNSSFTFIRELHRRIGDGRTTRRRANLSDTVLTIRQARSCRFMGNFDFRCGWRRQLVAASPATLKYQAALQVRASSPRYEYYSDGDGVQTRAPLQNAE